MAVIHSEMDNMKATISDVMTSLKTTVAELKIELANLKEKNDDLGGRMQRCNVRIAGVPEETGSSSPVAVSKLLIEVLN